MTDKNKKEVVDLDDDLLDIANRFGDDLNMHATLHTDARERAVKLIDELQLMRGIAKRQGDALERIASILFDVTTKFTSGQTFALADVKEAHSTATRCRIHTSGELTQFRDLQQKAVEAVDEALNGMPDDGEAIPPFLRGMQHAERMEAEQRATNAGKPFNQDDPDEAAVDASYQTEYADKGE